MWRYINTISKQSPLVDEFVCSYHLPPNMNIVRRNLMLITLINVKTGSLRKKSSRASDVPCDSGRAKIGARAKQEKEGRGGGGLESSLAREHSTSLARERLLRRLENG